MYWAGIESVNTARSAPFMKLHLEFRRQLYRSSPLDSLVGGNEFLLGETVSLEVITSVCMLDQGNT